LGRNAFAKDLAPKKGEGRDSQKIIRLVVDLSKGKANGLKKGSVKLEPEKKPL